MLEKEESSVTIVGEHTHVSKAGVAPVRDLEVLWRLSLPFSISGGVLADKIGSGKTGTVLGLVLEDKHLPADRRIPDPSDLPNGVPKLRPIRGTLVVMPSHLVGQWKAEQEAFAPSLQCLWIVNVNRSIYWIGGNGFGEGNL